VADLVLETPEGVPLRLELAGPGTRLLAAAVDGLVFLAFLAGTVLILALSGLAAGATVLLSGTIVLVVAYWFGTALLLDGRTPGKVATGLRVADAQGFAPRATQLLLRALFVPLEAVLVLPVPLVWILIAATPLRQRLGDLVAGTVVLRDGRRRAVREPVADLAWSQLAVHQFELDPAAVRRLDGRDLGLLRTLLTRRELDPAARVRLQRRTAEHYHARLFGAPRALDPDEARTFLRELFLCLRELRGEEPAAMRTDRSGSAAVRGAAPGAGSPPR